MTNKITIIKDILNKNNLLRKCNSCNLEYLPLYSQFDIICPRCNMNIEFNKEDNELLLELDE